MIIHILNFHKSIVGEAQFSLPDFCIITGKNGCGKTHFFEALVDRNVSSIVINDNILSKVQYIPYNGLNPVINDTFNPSTINEYINRAWTFYSNTIENMKMNRNLSVHFLRDRAKDQGMLEYFTNCIKQSGKSWEKLDPQDFRNSFEPSFLSNGSLFNVEFSTIFKNYHTILLENDLNELYESRGEVPSRPSLRKKDFYEKYGIPPWEFVNTILKESGFDYTVNNPIGTRIDQIFTFNLTDNSSGTTIRPTDLSTGERVIMSLALAIYNSKGDYGKPELLLLDEPDAGLHPILSKRLVEVLYQNIYLANGIAVIISSHSPTTIASNDGVAVFKKNRGIAVPEQTTIQEATEILTEGLPFLRISNDKRRQIFVESKYDVIYFDSLVSIYTRLGELNVQPLFFAAGPNDSSNCEDVKRLVDAFSQNGNDQVYGIIDWDLKNQSNNNIIVLGEGSRYSIENFVLDPLLIGILLLRDGSIDFNEFGIDTLKTYPDIVNITNEECQLIVYKVLEILELDAGHYLHYELLRGGDIEISEAFVKKQGHKLESIFKLKFPKLKRYHKEYELKQNVIIKVIAEFPGLSPKILLDTLKMIK
ncbi:MAG: AAA family ATPase [Chitinophagaceae bacterium]|jgi:ABC-type Mn2+/Zn2+ transport system ATPase subunit